MTTNLILLGTGTPNMQPQKYQSGYAVVVDERSYVVDCGGGVMQRISQAYERYQLEALAMPNLTRLFLTHLHPDHCTGLSDFLLASWVLERADTVTIYGSKGTQAMVDHLLAAYTIGIVEHRDGLAPINNPLDISVMEIQAGQVYQDDKVTIEVFPVSHGGLEAYGYKFTTPDKTIVISGDTCPCQTLIDKATGADILVHEVYSAEQFKTRPEGWQKYHSTVHTSTIELADIANKVQPKLLILTHQLYWGATDDSLLAEIGAHYAGEVVSGSDLDIF
jgi:ribonuclease BN (tRNA processing enzyme)